MDKVWFPKVLGLRSIGFGFEFPKGFSMVFNSFSSVRFGLSRTLVF